jgi:hypothetical protein
MCEGEKKKDSSSGALYCVNLALRIVVLGLAVAAAALMATASQCTIFLYYGGPLHTITYKDFGPFVYAQIKLNLVVQNTKNTCRIIFVYLCVVFYV